MSLTVASPSEDDYPDGEVVAAQPATLAALIQQSLVQEYTQARQEYKQAHARYSARVKPTVPSRFERYCTGAFQDVHFYTSAPDPVTCCAPGCTHHTHKAGLREVNDHLRLRAEERLSAALPRRTCTGDDVFALLVTQEAAELSDLFELEAAVFRELAYAYYDYMYGPADRVAEAESHSRRQLEDDFHEASQTLLKQLQEETWQAEQRLFLRVYGMCPELLPHQSQLRAAALTDEVQQHNLRLKNTLDCADAVPLWHRACVIRGETESEEDISFRRLAFACLVQAHAMEEEYVERDAATGCLRRTNKPVPAYMRDAVDYSLRFEHLALVWNEETDRMAITDAAEAALSAQLTP
ncbi:hypothetical protein ABB37_01489 [Leptomonas pyrrhocoris]|uniref:Uncharacterized protein n=1 Tax=Leptomonas pyrrhocoris TaxID=157538 RepID=A0A0M9G944_LEPPY|nr:hypothetical protein ABB37_01489 [Leptomonas pyrrhocoris]KPA85079.1 hypothetical protein ABB37_01489 [Leptomonas pyrrhocoris]|eukprot:XP_015663518.1 hypothetical protein ABB37_01489 [Leptomonas pyrrhocoris]